MFNPKEQARMEGGIDVPPGVYLVKLEEFTRKQSEKSGKDYLNIKLRIIDGDHKDSIIYDMCSLSENALWRLGNLCLSMGVQDQFDIEHDSEVKRMLVGKVGKCKTKYEDYNGQKNTRVAQWMLLDESEENRRGELTAAAGTGGEYPF